MTGEVILTYYSKERLRTVRNAVRAMLAQQFPQEAARSLLSSYIDILDSLESDIEKLAISGASLTDLSQTSRVVFAKISQIVQALGILQRSSSLRISFELAAAVRRMCLTILKSDPNLQTRQFMVICASEWDYSPIYYPKFDLQEDMILLGLPASESDNALMLPIMAHEVGHAFWAYSRTRDALRVIVEDRFRYQVFNKWDILLQAGIFQGIAKPTTIGEMKSNIMYSNLITSISGPVLRQAEETFCDFLGLALFSSAYLSAFSYLAGMGAHRDYSKIYCSSATRSSLLLCASDKATIIVPIAFSEAFQTANRRGSFPYRDDDLDRDATSGSNPLQLVLAISELTITNIAERIWEIADGIANTSSLNRASAARIDDALKYFKALVPTPPEFNPREALCAAWKESDALRDQIGSFADVELPDKWANCMLRDIAIRECVAKSLEVYELERGCSI